MTMNQGTNGQVTARIPVEKMWRVLRELFGDSRLCITFTPGGVDICNPKHSDKGHCFIDYRDGYVCWERPAVEFWGILEPFAGEGEQPDGTVPARKIIDMLT